MEEVENGGNPGTGTAGNEEKEMQKAYKAFCETQVLKEEDGGYDDSVTEVTYLSDDEEESLDLNMRNDPIMNSTGQGNALIRGERQGVISLESMLSSSHSVPRAGTSAASPSHQTSVSPAPCRSPQPSTSNGKTAHQERSQSQMNPAENNWKWDGHYRLPHTTQAQGEAQAESYRCLICNASFSEVQALYEHANAHEPNVFPCSKCHRRFTSMKKLKYHLRAHNPYQFKCPCCFRKYKTSANLRRHLQIIHGIPSLDSTLDNQDFNF